MAIQCWVIELGDCFDVLNLFPWGLFIMIADVFTSLLVEILVLGCKRLLEKSSKTGTSYFTWSKPVSVYCIVMSLSIIRFRNTTIDHSIYDLCQRYANLAYYSWYDSKIPPQLSISCCLNNTRIVYNWVNHTTIAFPINCKQQYSCISFNAESILCSLWCCAFQGESTLFLQWDKYYLLVTSALPTNSVVSFDWFGDQIQYIAWGLRIYKLLSTCTKYLFYVTACTCWCILVLYGWAGILYYPPIFTVCRCSEKG